MDARCPPSPPRPHGARADVHDELVRAAEALHPGTLARRLGLHLSTVRRHLDALEAAGLVTREVEPRSGPGRPRVTFRARRTSEEDGTVCAGYRFVAESLAEWIEEMTDEPFEAAAAVGDAWGRHLVNAPPFSHTSRQEAIARVCSLLEQLGYEPSREGDGGDTLELGRCPFASLTDQHPEIGCGLHFGLIRGALERLGSPVRIVDFQPSPGDAGVCAVLLEDAS